MSVSNNNKRASSAALDEEAAKAAKAAKRHRGVNSRRQQRATEMHAQEWGEKKPSPKDRRVLKDLLSSSNVGYSMGNSLREYLLEVVGNDTGMSQGVKDMISMCLKNSEPTCRRIMRDPAKHEAVLDELRDPDGSSEAHETVRLAVARFNSRSRFVLRIIQGLMCMFGEHHAATRTFPTKLGVVGFADPVVKGRGTNSKFQLTLLVQDPSGGVSRHIFVYIPREGAVRMWEPVCLRQVNCSTRLVLGSPLVIEVIPAVEKFVASIASSWDERVLGKDVAATVSEYLV
jgi:hypothetical protein